jgi:hypothetical protein
MRYIEKLKQHTITSITLLVSKADNALADQAMLVCFTNHVYEIWSKIEMFVVQYNRV